MSSVRWVPPLPPNWEAKFDQTQRRYFFINHRTKLTTWDDPRYSGPAVQKSPQVVSGHHTQHAVSGQHLQHGQGQYAQHPQQIPGQHAQHQQHMQQSYYTQKHSGHGQQPQPAQHSPYAHPRPASQAQPQTPPKSQMLPYQPQAPTHVHAPAPAAPQPAIKPVFIKVDGHTHASTVPAESESEEETELVDLVSKESLQELKAAFPGCSEAFIREKLERNFGITRLAAQDIEMAGYSRVSAHSGRGSNLSVEFPEAPHTIIETILLQFDYDVERSRKELKDMGYKSAIEKASSPARQSTSPSHQAGGSSGRPATSSPLRQATSPTRASVSPTRTSVSPTRTLVSPTRASASPTRITTDIHKQREQRPANCYPRYYYLRKWPNHAGYGFHLNYMKNELGEMDDDSPASEAGIRCGDKIIEINDVNTERETHQQVVARIKSNHDAVGLLLVDKKTYDYYQKCAIRIHNGLPEVVRSRASAGKEHEQRPANCYPRYYYLRKWPNHAGYGFHLKCMKNELGEVDDDSPASEAGIRCGDTIIEINDVNTERETHQQVVARIKSNHDAVGLLLVDKKTYDYYQKCGIRIHNGLPEVVRSLTSAGQVRQMLIGEFPEISQTVIDMSLSTCKNDALKTRTLLKTMTISSKSPERSAQSSRVSSPSRAVSPVYTPSAHVTEQKKKEMTDRLCTEFPNLVRAVVDAALKSCQFSEVRARSTLKATFKDNRGKYEAHSSTKNKAQKITRPAGKSSPTDFLVQASDDLINKLLSTCCIQSADESASSQPVDTTETQREDEEKEEENDRARVTPPVTTQAIARHHVHAAMTTSAYRTTPQGPNPEIHKGPDKSLLLLEYVQAKGPNPEIHHGPNSSLACGPRGAQGPDKSLPCGPQAKQHHQRTAGLRYHETAVM